MTKALQFIIITLIFISCNSVNILKYKTQRFYTEKNVISEKEENVLIQKVCYDKPRVVDEAYCHNLIITILDLDEAKRKKTLNISTDTLIVKCYYDLASVWNWSKEKSEITGTIEIQKWENKEVKLKENIVVEIEEEGRKQKRIFKGQRTFVK